MLAYLIDNKQWLFSGLGITALGAIFIVGRFIWSTVRRRRYRTPDVHAAPAAPEAEIPKPKQADYINGVVRVRNGAYVDLPSSNSRQDDRIRVAVTAIENTESLLHVRLRLDLGGALSTCGRKVKNESTNTFLAPAKDGHEEDYSIFHFFNHPNGFIFLRIFIAHIDPQSTDVDIDFARVRGVWLS